MYQQNYQNQPNNTLSANTMALKQFFSSPIFLIMGITLLAANFVSLIGSIVFITTFDFTSIVQAFNNITENPETVESFLDSIGSSTNSFSGSFSIFSTISGIAFILLYNNAKKPMQSIKGSVNILKILSLIEFIIVCVGCGIVPLILLLLGICAIISPDEFLFVVITFGIIGISIMTIVIILSIMPYKFYKSIYDSVTTPNLTQKFATALGVLNIISLISVPATLTTIFTSLNSPVAIFSSLYIIASTTFTVLQTIFFFKYKSFVETENTQRYFANQQPVMNNYPPQPTTNYAPQPDANYTSQPYTEPMQTTTANSEYVYCPSCSAQVRKEDFFCQNCGHKMSE